MNYILIILLIVFILAFILTVINYVIPNKHNQELDKFELLEDGELSNSQTKPKMVDYNGNPLMEETNESEIESLLFNIPEHPREKNARVLKGETYRKPLVEKDGFHRLNKFEGETDDIFKE